MHGSPFSWCPLLRATLAFPNGAAPEIVEHGRTGYLCADEDEMVAALGYVHGIDRGPCRVATAVFPPALGRRYERLYQSCSPPAVARRTTSIPAWARAGRFATGTARRARV